MSEVCPQCNHPTTPDNIFPVSDGPAYHILCYQDACLAAGQPDPFPACDGCKQIIWEFDANGELQMVVKGSVCFTDPTTNEPNWRAARWHPVCAPSEDSPEIDETDDGDDDTPSAEGAPSAHDDMLHVSQLDNGEFVVDRGGVLAKHEKEIGTGMAEAAMAEELADVEQAMDDGHPICPLCENTIQRQPTKYAALLYHRTCAAKMRARERKAVKASPHPRCPTCRKPVTPSQVAAEKTIECEVEGGGIDHYHRTCYRRACLAAGMEDPFPPDPQATRARLEAGKERAAERRKNATVHCGICSTDVLRSEFPAHVVPCKEAARAAEAANNG